MGNKVGYIIQLQDRFSRAARKIQKQMKGIGKDAGKAAKANKKLSRSFKGLKNTAKNALGGFIAAFSVREFIRRGGAFQDAIADLSAITGATGKDLSNLSDETLRLAKASATSQVEVARAIKLIASAKPELLDNLGLLLSTTEQTLLLKNAGVELSIAAIAVAEGLNQFGEGAEFAARNVNILAAGSKLGSSEIADTADAVKLAGPLARAAGLSFLQLNAAIQATAKGGIKGTQAGTALSAIFGKLRRLGFDFQKLGLAGTFKKIAKILNNVTDSTQRAKVEAKLFGEEHAKVGLALVNNVKDLENFEKILKGTNVAQEQAKIRLATFNARMRSVGVTINDKIIKAFERLEPQLTKMVKGFGEFIDQISAEELEGFVDTLGVIAKAIAIIGKGVAFLVNQLAKLGTGLGETAAAVASLDFGQFSDKRIQSFVDVGFSPFGFSPVGKLLTNALFGNSQTDVNVNLKAPENTVESLKTQTSGNVRGLNVGVNMETVGG